MMKLNVWQRIGVVCFALLGMRHTLVFAESYDVSEIEILGTQRVDSDAVRSQLKSIAGTVTREQISEDVKALFRNGFFERADARILDLPKSNRKKLVFTVVEKPTVRKVFIKGNKEISESDLRDILRMDGQRFVDESKARTLAQTTVKYYKAQGFFDADVQWETTPVGENQVDLTFAVKEGTRYQVRKVHLEGTTQIDDSEALTRLTTRRYKWWSSWLFGTGRLNEDALQNDRSVLRQYLLDHGFVEGSVGDPTVEKKGDGLVVTFPVREGRVFTIGEISVVGDLVEGDPGKTIEGIESASGDVFDASKIREDTFKISEKFTDKGFAYANVVPDTSIQREQGTVDIEFNVNKGKEITVNRISVRGNDKTYENVVRRELRIGEQELYSSSAIATSQKRLQRLGFFEEVSIATEPAKEPEMVDLTVNVREASTGSFSAGAGYSSADGALVTAKLTEANLFGTGRSANLTADLGSQNENLLLSLDDKRFNDTYLAVGIDAQKTDREYNDFDRVSAGGGLTLGYPLEQVFGSRAENWDAALMYQYYQIEIDNVEPDAAPLVKEQEGKTTVSSLTPRLTRSTIDNPLNPTSGSRQTFSVELAGPGGEEEFYLIEARNQWYYPLAKSSWGDLIFSWRLRFGYGEPTGDSEALPLFKRFFPGGINSVRGYEERTLGPKDENGNEYGGSKQLVNNAELIFPLINSAGLKGVVFYDIGEAFDDNDSIQFGDLRQAYGYGLRWTSPLGPIRIEFGFPIDKQEGERSMVTLFAFGAPF